MNFWTPTFHSWGKDLDACDMPWYAFYDYVEVYKWDPVEEAFHFHWRDDFDSFDAGRWHRANGSFEANSSVFHPSNVYTEDGALVLKMEPAHHHHDASFVTEHRVETLGKHFPREPLHAKNAPSSDQVPDSIEIPPVHDAFVDSHLYEKHKHPEKQLLEHR